MARRSVKSVARSALGGIRTKSLLAGAAAGAGAGYAASALGPYGPGAASVAVGVVMKNETLQVLGAYQLGAALVAPMPGSATPSGGFL